MLAAGLTWVGPPPDAIEAMGSKISSKRLAAAAGVPVLAELDPRDLTGDRAPSAYPVLIKASAGGGGRGMRVVRSPAELTAALASASREAAAAFGDGMIYCEPLLTGAKHVEVQVLADSQGTIWALTERDCSVQRRYQKVIEETPSPAVSPPLRARLLAAAGALTSAVGYIGAGTAEFLLAPDGRFYFLEFNTRLQVEHPVTECLHGIDLVALQLEIAEGAALPTDPPPAAGHAIEARLYAEDPADRYRPSTGPVHGFAVPGVDARFEVPASRFRTGPGLPAGLRLDSGIEPGSQIGPYYDAMLAKIISWAPDRTAATRRLATALAGTVLHGPASNRDLLVSVLRSDEFRSGSADTSLLDRIDLAGTRPDERACRLSALAAALAAAAQARTRVPRGGPALGGWRNVPSQPQRRSYLSPVGLVEAAYWWTRTGVAVADWREAPALEELAGAQGRPVVADFSPGQVTLAIGGARYRFSVASYPEATWVDSALGAVRLTPAERLPAPPPAAQAGSLLAPMPGSVIRIGAAPGEPVAAGQTVVVLEAMKMEHPVSAPAAGLLAELRVAPGDQVAAGEVLAVIAVQPDPALPQPGTRQATDQPTSVQQTTVQQMTVQQTTGPPTAGQPTTAHPTAGQPMTGQRTAGQPTPGQESNSEDG